MTFDHGSTADEDEAAREIRIDCLDTVHDVLVFLLCHVGHVYANSLVINIMLEVPDDLLPLKTLNLGILSHNSEVFLDPRKWLGNFSEKLWVRNLEAFIIEGEIITNLAILSHNSEVFLNPRKWLGNFSEKLWVRNLEAFIIEGETITEGEIIH